jgi:nucleoid DNA-binding protein
MLEVLIEVWSDELANGGRIELENFLVLEVKTVDRGERAGSLLIGGKLRRAPRVIKKLAVRPSKFLRARMKTQ